MHTYDYDNEFSKNSKFRWDFHCSACKLDRWGILQDRYDQWRKGESNISQGSIPKIIHQIWIGSKVPRYYDAWRASWQKHHPDFEYRLWSETDILKFGLQNEEAFVQSPNPGTKSDIARYEILYRLGGIYADTDFECLTRFDKLNSSTSFFAGQVFSAEPQICNALIGAIPGHKLLELVINSISEPVRGNNISEIFQKTGPIALTETFFSNYHDLDRSTIIFPSDYFYPWPNFLMRYKEKRYDYVSDESMAIHHWEVSWVQRSRLSRFRRNVKNLIELNFTI